MIARVSVVCFKYNIPGYRTRFTATMVNKTFLGLARNVGPDVPFEFVCITDDKKGLMSDVFTRPILPAFRGLRNPTSLTRPNCYPRLTLFDPSNPYGLQEYFLSIDLDVVITGDVTKFIQHWRDFIVWKIRGRFCGSLFGGRVGATPQLFTDFDPLRSPRLTHEAGLKGSDQAWFEYKLPDAPVWTAADGIYGWQDEIGVKPPRRRLGRPPRIIPIVPPRSNRPDFLGMNPLLRRQQEARQARAAALAAAGKEGPPVRPHGAGNLPPDARMVFFYGEPKAWDPSAQEQSPWILQHYR